MSYYNFHPVDEFAFDHGLAMDQDLAPTRFLGDISMSFESSSFSGQEPTSVSYTGDYSQISMDTLDYQESADLMPFGILAPSETDCVSNPPQHFDGEFLTQDTYWKDVKGYMDKHGRPPHLSAFGQEDFSYGRVAGSKSKNAPKNAPKNPATPARRRAAPPPKPAKQAVSCSPAATTSISESKRPQRQCRRDRGAFTQEGQERNN